MIDEVKSEIVHFAIVNLGRQYGLKLRNKRGVLNSCYSISESLNVSYDELKVKVKEFSGNLINDTIYFKDENKIKLFIENYLNPQLVMLELVGILIEPKSWGH